MECQNHISNLYLIFLRVHQNSLVDKGVLSGHVLGKMTKDAQGIRCPSSFGEGTVNWDIESKNPKPPNVVFLIFAKLKRVEEEAIGHSNPLLGMTIWIPNSRWIPEGIKESQQLPPHQGLAGQSRKQEKGQMCLLMQYLCLTKEQT